MSSALVSPPVCPTCSDSPVQVPGPQGATGPAGPAGSPAFNPSTITRPYGAFAVAHGLGHVPKYLRTVLVCLNSDLGFSAGSEVDITTASVNGAAPAFLIAADASIVGFNVNVAVAAPLLINASTGVAAAITVAKWEVKMYFQ